MPESELLISRNAYRKIQMYTDKVDTECGGFLLFLEGSDRILFRDALLVSDQLVSGASVRINQVAAAQAKAEVENLSYNGNVYRIGGLWHSHVNMRARPSCIDKVNLENILSCLAENTERAEFLEREEIDGYILEKNSIRVRMDGFDIAVNLDTESYFRFGYDNSNAPDGFSYANGVLFFNKGGKVLSLKDFNGLDMGLSKPERKKMRGAGEVYSLIVNKRGDSHAELARCRWCYVCDREEVEKIDNIPLRIVDVEDDLEFTEQDIEKEISRKVKECQMIQKS